MDFRAIDNQLMSCFIYVKREENIKDLGLKEGMAWKKYFKTNCTGLRLWGFGILKPFTVLFPEQWKWQCLNMFPPAVILNRQIVTALIIVFKIDPFQNGY